MIGNQLKLSERPLKRNMDHLKTNWIFFKKRRILKYIPPDDIRNCEEIEVSGFHRR